ncbi:MAG: hypothetical protein CM15mP63_3720 [Gammaproteobacteria bacterium]|nr:MAG: hypothetical protein CM15mP63_3720 [Gammaproteobacteria bacterium]
MLLQKAQILNPMLSVYPINMKVDENFDTQKIKSANLVIDSTDNYITRSLINKITLNYKKPLIMGSAIKFSGQVALFRNDIKTNLAIIVLQH